ncbi:MAG: hypothetical protein D3911_03505 [Candidatus Electrothrix sp. AW3_4]|nr:hypothetical protein [Candidatus Electrothrix gigas]
MKKIINLIIIISILLSANISSGIGGIDFSKPFKKIGGGASKIYKNTRDLELKDLDCFNRNSQCREELRNFDKQRLDLMKGVVGDLCVENSKVTLSRNINKSRNKLSNVQVYYLKKYFGDLIYKVQFIWDSNLNDHITYQGRTLKSGSEAQTYGYNVYMFDKNQKNDTWQILTMAHELYHVKQYEYYGNSIQKYCNNYMWQWVEGGFSYHDIKMEVEAYSGEYKFASWLNKEVEKIVSIKKEFREEPPKKDLYFSSHSPYVNRRGFNFPSHLEVPKSRRVYLVEEERKREKKKKIKKEKKRRQMKKEMESINEGYRRLNLQGSKKARPSTVSPELQSARDELEAFLNQ